MENANYENASEGYQTARILGAGPEMKVVGLPDELKKTRSRLTPRQIAEIEHEKAVKKRTGRT